MRFKSAFMSRFYPPSVDIKISAPVETVWKVLLDGTRYPDWNRFIIKIDGVLTELGRPIGMTVKLGKRTVYPKMQTVSLEPPTEDDKPARWIHHYASWPARLGLIRSTRHHELYALEEGRQTRYLSWEPFTGPLKPFLPFKAIDAGFKIQGEQLKTHCESRG